MKIVVHFFNVVSIFYFRSDVPMMQDILFCNACTETDLSLCFICQSKRSHLTLTRPGLEAKEVVWKHHMLRSSTELTNDTFQLLSVRLDTFGHEKFTELDCVWHRSCFDEVANEEDVEQLIVKRRKELGLEIPLRKEILKKAIKQGDVTSVLLTGEHSGSPHQRENQNLQTVSAREEWSGDDAGVAEENDEDNGLRLQSGNCENFVQ